jgi:hypothetical protein
MKSDGSMNKTKKEVGMKSKMELTADTVRKLIEEKKPSSFTRLAHMLGYKGSVSSSLTKKFRTLLPDIDDLLNRATKSAACGGKPTAGETMAKAVKSVKHTDTTVKSPANQVKAKPAGAKGGKYARDPRNPFRAGSSYGTVVDIMASYPNGVEKEMLIRLVAAETGKSLTRAGYDCQVVLSARPNQDGLSNNDSPRNRSCRPGFWVKRENDCVTLMVG